MVYENNKQGNIVSYISSVFMICTCNNYIEIHTSKGRNTIVTAIITFKFLKINNTTTKMTEKTYTNGKLVSNKSSTSKTKLKHHLIMLNHLNHMK